MSKRYPDPFAYCRSNFIDPATLDRKNILVPNCPQQDKRKESGKQHWHSWDFVSIRHLSPVAPSLPYEETDHTRTLSGMAYPLTSIWKVNHLLSFWARRTSLPKWVFFRSHWSRLLLTAGHSPGRINRLLSAKRLQISNRAGIWKDNIILKGKTRKSISHPWVISTKAALLFTFHKIQQILKIPILLNKTEAKEPQSGIEMKYCVALIVYVLESRLTMIQFHSTIPTSGSSLQARFLIFVKGNTSSTFFMFAVKNKFDNLRKGLYVILGT